MHDDMLLMESAQTFHEANLAADRAHNLVNKSFEDSATPDAFVHRELGLDEETFYGLAVVSKFLRRVQDALEGVNPPRNPVT